MMKNRNDVLSICRLLVVASPLFLIGMLFWAYQLDLESIASHGDVEFPPRFWWWMFYAAAALGYLGCLGLAAALESRTVFKSGLLTLAIVCGLLFCMFSSIAFPSVNIEGLSGAAWLTFAFFSMVAGVSLVLIGAIRIGRAKFQSQQSK